jgi:hypothetical protein
VIGIIGDFGAAAEGAAQASNELAVANVVKGWSPDFVMTLGDDNYPGGAASTIDQNIGQFYHEFIYPYLGSYGSGATSNRFFPCLGNHDWLTSNGQPHNDYFALPGNERYYTYRYGPVEIFAINSNADSDGTTPTSVRALAARQLAASTRRGGWFISSPALLERRRWQRHLRWPFADWGARRAGGHDHHTRAFTRTALSISLMDWWG